MVNLSELISNTAPIFHGDKGTELDLRGKMIEDMYDLNATANKFDIIDLSGNKIGELKTSSRLDRLGALRISGNRITKIDLSIGECLPNLHTLFLEHNRLVKLADIDPLASLKNLLFLSLLENGIRKKRNYRLYVIHKLDSVLVLDYQRVKTRERREAKKWYSSVEAKKEVAKESTKTFSPGEVSNVSAAAGEQRTPKAVAPTPEQITVIETSNPEMQKKRKMGNLPSPTLTPTEETLDKKK